MDYETRAQLIAKNWFTDSGFGYNYAHPACKRLADSIYLALREADQQIRHEKRPPNFSNDLLEAVQMYLVACEENTIPSLPTERKDRVYRYLSECGWFYRSVAGFHSEWYTDQPNFSRVVKTSEQACFSILKELAKHLQEKNA